MFFRGASFCYRCFHFYRFDHRCTYPLSWINGQPGYSIYQASLIEGTINSTASQWIGFDTSNSSYWYQVTEPIGSQMVFAVFDDSENNDQSVEWPEDSGIDWTPLEGALSANSSFTGQLSPGGVQNFLTVVQSNGTCPWDLFNGAVTRETSSNKATSSHLGAILGGVGGAVALLILAFGILLWRRKKKSKVNELPNHVEEQRSLLPSMQNTSQTDFVNRQSISSLNDLQQNQQFHSNIPIDLPHSQSIPQATDNRIFSSLGLRSKLQSKDLPNQPVSQTPIPTSFFQFTRQPSLLLPFRSSFSSLPPEIQEIQATNDHHEVSLAGPSNGSMSTYAPHQSYYQRW
jgi:hypothetical protein